MRIKTKFYVVYGRFPEGLEWFISCTASGKIMERGFKTEQAARDWLRKLAGFAQPADHRGKPNQRG